MRNLWRYIFGEFNWLFSLHIRSMWETICDAWACWSGWNFGPNPTVYPYSVTEYPPPPTPNENCPNLSVTEYPPPMKIVRESKSESQNIPQNENCQRVQIRVSQNTPQNENCQRVQIWVSQNTPPQKKSKLPTFFPKFKSKDSGIPPHPQNRKTFRFQTSE